MKVLQINSVIEYGSTGRICRDLADILLADGHECVIAYGRGLNNSDYRTIKIGNKLDHYLHFIKSYLFNRHGFGSKRATRKFIKEIENYNPDIIHIHNIHGYYLNIEILFDYFKRKNIPIVWLLHDTWAISGGAASFEININEDNTLIQKFKGTHNAYPRALQRLNYKTVLYDKKQAFTSINNMIIVTPSKWLSKIINQTYLNKFTITTIHNGIDLDQFKPAASGISSSPKRFIVLAVASVWTKDKGIDLIKKLPSKLPDNYDIILIGHLEKNENLPTSIKHIPRTQNIYELIKWYNIADVFVNPTLLDNFPTVNLESLACGTPVITYDTGGSKEALNQDTGIIIEKGNEKDFIRAIKDWPNKTNEIQQQCVKQSENFNKNKQYIKYLTLYNKLVSIIKK